MCLNNKQIFGILKPIKSVRKQGRKGCFKVFILTIVQEHDRYVDSSNYKLNILEIATAPLLSNIMIAAQPDHRHSLSEETTLS